MKIVMRAKPRKTRSQPRRRDIGSVSNFNSGKPAQDDCLGLCEIGHYDRLSIVSETPKSTAYAGLMESRQTTIQTECFKRNGQDLALDEILKLQVVKLGSRKDNPTNRVPTAHNVFGLGNPSIGFLGRNFFQKASNYAAQFGGTTSHIG
ncbi:hypothetical protein [Bradyrhizobium sp. CCBAU 45394]|uniref:hypothetical protein n=1 Tax=Bradyrhizobium sp. CCBAU 45394 TaxID=1325087 RepID=UPI002304B703|nr:hypothetical protein [Bradyrhizobium sp. CCBAU 45394]